MERCDLAPWWRLPAYRHCPRRSPTRLSASLALAAAVLVTGCAGDRRDEAGQEAAPAAAPAATQPDRAPVLAPASADRAGASNVEVMPVRLQDFTIDVFYLGTLEPEERVVLKAEAEGVAERVRFDEGSAVSKDAVMVNISTESLRVRLDQAQSDLKLADANLKRAESLATQKLISPAELDQVRNRRESAFHAWESAKIELDKSIVKAPISGVVKTKSVSAGEYLAKGQSIAEILAVERLRARISVPEGELRYLEKGKRVKVDLDALPGERFEGAVRSLGIEADPGSRSFPVEVELDNRAGRMRPGMLARVEVRLSSLERQVLIPRYAVVERESGRFVYVERDGRAEQRRVQLGAGAGELVQVTGGLSEGERVVVTGHQLLTDNEAVAVIRVVDSPALGRGLSP
jgi:membrane fusion protein (multidrug efflux system)